MKLFNICLLLGGALLISACSTQRHYVNANSIEGTRAVTHTQDFYFDGIGQTEEVNAASLCGGQNRVAATETKQSDVNILVSLVTLGIYTPREHTAYCF